MVIVVVKWVHLLALGVWLGSIVLLSFVVAPTVFASFGEGQRAEAGRIMSAIFPGYYRVGAVCGAVLLCTSFLLWRRVGSGATYWGAATLVASGMLGVALYAGGVVQPRAHALRAQIGRADTPPAVKMEFDLLHRRSVQLNVAALLGAVVMTGIAAANLRS